MFSTVLHIDGFNRIVDDLKVNTSIAIGMTIGIRAARSDYSNYSNRHDIHYRINKLFMPLHDDNTKHVTRSRI